MKIPAIRLLIAAIANGFHLTRPMLIAAIKAAIFGDILQNVKNRMLPYELQKGETMRLYHKWMDICKDVVRDGGYFKFQRTVKQMVKEFDNIPIDEKLWKPKVGIVGESRHISVGLIVVMGNSGT